MLKLALAFIIICAASVIASAQSYTTKAALAAAVEEVVQTPQKPSYSLPKQPQNKVGSPLDLLFWGGLIADEVTTYVKRKQGCVEAGLVKNRVAATIIKGGLAVGWELGEVKNPNFAASKVNKSVKATAGTLSLGAAGWNASLDCRR